MFKYFYIDNYDCKTVEQGASNISDLMYVIANRKPEYSIIINEFSGYNCIARLNINADGSCSVRIKDKDSELGYNLHRIADKLGIKDKTVVEKYGMGIDTGDWHDLESLRGVIKCQHKMSEKQYIPTFCYFVEYEKDGYKYKGVTDKKTIVSALLDDVTVKINTIYIRTTDSWIYGYITNNTSDKSFIYVGYGLFAIDMQWLKWYRRI